MSVKQLLNYMSRRLLSAVACLKPFPCQHVKLTSADHGPLTGDIDCMYILYISKKKTAVYCLRVMVAYQRPSQEKGMCHTLICQHEQEECCFRFPLEAYSK